MMKKESWYLYLNGTTYMRRHDLEDKNMHVVIIDDVSSKKIRIINVYCSLRPPGNQSPEAFFLKQLLLMKKAISSDCYLVGDLNLEAKMENRPDYNRKNLLDKMLALMLEENMIQIVNFDTWSRVVNGLKKSSMLTL